MTDGEVKDLNLAPSGRERIEWADNQMRALRQIRSEFEERKPLLGYRISACLHVTAETANLILTMKAGGAEIALCASNPLSTQDDVAASLMTDFQVPVFAMRGEDSRTYYRHISCLLERQPQLLMDNGADLSCMVHKGQIQVPELIGGTEDTSTGLTRLRSLERQRILRFPIIAVNEAQTKYLLANRHGTGQSTIDGIIRATNILFAGKAVIVCGYGACGKGIARRAAGMGAHTVVVEVDPIRALEAAMDGFVVMPMARAAAAGDVFITATGELNVIRHEHFLKMKDGAILCNAGHFNAEIDLPALEELADHKKEEVRPYVQAYYLGERRIYLLAEGRLVNLSLADGHPGTVMDMSCSNHALAIEYLINHHRSLENKVYPVPLELDRKIAFLKLKAMGLEIDTLTPEQEQYLITWERGTL